MKGLKSGWLVLYSSIEKTSWGSSFSLLDHGGGRAESFPASLRGGSAATQIIIVKHIVNSTANTVYATSFAQESEIGPSLPDSFLSTGCSIQSDRPEPDGSG